MELKGARRRNNEGKNSVCDINIILSLANIHLFRVGEEISLGEVEDVEEEDDTPPTLPNALPDNDDSTMPPKKTTTTTAATAPTATAAKKPPPSVQPP